MSDARICKESRNPVHRKPQHLRIAIQLEACWGKTKEKNTNVCYVVGSIHSKIYMSDMH